MHQDGRQAMDDAHQQWVEAERLSAAQPSMHVHQSEIRNGIVFRDNILQQPREKEAKHFEHVTAVVIGEPRHLPEKTAIDHIVESHPKPNCEPTHRKRNS